MTTSRAAIARTGMKARIADLLRAREAEGAPDGLTLGEIGARLDLPKTRHPELSAALTKLRDEGSIRRVKGPATAPTGPRFVNRYRWARRPAKPLPPDIDDRRFISFCR